MEHTGRIRYLRDPEGQVEVILCRNSGISYPLHNHVSVFTAGMVLEGSIRLTVGGSARVLQVNEPFLIPPYAPHSMEAAGRYTLMSICVGREALERGGTEGTAALLRRLLPEKDREITGGRLLELADRLDRWRDGLRSPPGDAFVAPLRRRLEQFPERPCSVGELAGAAMLSKYHFIRKFKQEVGLTPHQFQMPNRVRKAQRLLADTETMTEAALAAGFCDQSHFIRVFKRYVGLTPAVYQASCAWMEAVLPLSTGRG